MERGSKSSPVGLGWTGADDIRPRMQLSSRNHNNENQLRHFGLTMQSPFSWTGSACCQNACCQDDYSFLGFWDVPTGRIQSPPRPSRRDSPGPSGLETPSVPPEWAGGEGNVWVSFVGLVLPWIEDNQCFKTMTQDDHWIFSALVYLTIRLSVSSWLFVLCNLCYSNAMPTFVSRKF